MPTSTLHQNHVGQRPAFDSRLAKRHAKCARKAILSASNLSNDAISRLRKDMSRGEASVVARMADLVLGDLDKARAAARLVHQIASAYADGRICADDEACDATQDDEHGKVIAFPGP